MQVLLDNLANCIQSKSSYPNVAEAAYALLKRIRQNPDQLSLVCHPLGFLLIKLGVLDSSSSLRLHIWLPNQRTTQKPEWLIHNHAFTLNSHVLIGQLTNNVFHIDLLSDQPTGYLYSVKYEGGQSILRKTSQALAYNQCSQTTYAQGGYYSVEKGDFHSTQVSLKELTVSIVLSSEQEAVSPYVIGELEAEKSYAYYRIAASEKMMNTVFSILDSRLPL